MVNATLIKRDRVYKFMKDREEYFFCKTTIAKATSTLNTINEIIRDLLKYKMIEVVYKNGAKNYIAV